MWWLLPNLLVSILVDVLLVVDGEQGVWVDGHQDGARECLREIVRGMGEGEGGGGRGEGGGGRGEGGGGMGDGGRGGGGDK